MTALQLYETLKKLSESHDLSKLPVLMAGGRDHTYRVVSYGSLGTVGKRDRDYCEWFGKSSASPDEKPVKAIVLS